MTAPTPDPSKWLTDLLAGQQQMLRIFGGGAEPAASTEAAPSAALPFMAPWLEGTQAMLAWQQQLGSFWSGALPGSATAAALDDRRFAGEAWRKDPRFDAMSRAYLAMAQMVRKNLDAAPLDERGKAQWGFVLRQLVDALSPANCLATNPEALQTALDSGGASLVEGLFARTMYLSLYKMHELALHGHAKVALDTLARLIVRRTEPHVKLH